MTDSRTGSKNSIILDINIKKSHLLWIGLILCIFVGAMHSVLTYVALGASFFLALILGKNYSERPSYELCVGLLYLLVFQNLCIGLGAHLFGNSSDNLKLLTQIPFLVATVLWLFSISNKKFKLNLTNALFLILICLIAYSFLTSSGEFQAKLVNIRNLTVFFMAFCLGKNNIKDKSQLNKCIVCFLNLAKIVLFFGIILLIGGYPLYKAIGIHEVYIAKTSPLAEGGLPGRFGTTLYSTQRIERMGSIYYEPVNLAYFFAISFILSIFVDYTKSKSRKGINMVLMGIGLLLTIGKGGYLIVGAVFCCLVCHKIFNKIFDHKLSFIFTATTLIVLVVIFCKFYISHVGGAVLPHFWGIVNTWESIKFNPLGYGLGVGGNAANSLGGGLGDSWLSTGGETALMSYMYQLGIFGVIVFIACVLSLAPKINKSNITVCMVYLPLILLGVSLMQDNTFTPQCIIPFMLFQGAIKSVESHENKGTK